MNINSKSKLALTVSGICVFLFFASGSANAQDTNESRDVGASLFDEIKVTARRREESLYETPAAVTAMSSEVMTSLNISNLEDVGKYVPNLTIARYGVGNTAHASVFIRGIGRLLAWPWFSRPRPAGPRPRAIRMPSPASTPSWC